MAPHARLRLDRDRDRPLHAAHEARRTPRRRELELEGLHATPRVALSGVLHAAHDLRPAATPEAAAGNEPPVGGDDERRRGDVVGAKVRAPRTRTVRGMSRSGAGPGGKDAAACGARSVSTSSRSGRQWRRKPPTPKPAASGNAPPSANPNSTRPSGRDSVSRA